jgi:hypothetical protein
MKNFESKINTILRSATKEELVKIENILNDIVLNIQENEKGIDKSSSTMSDFANAIYDMSLDIEKLAIDSYEKRSK